MAYEFSAADEVMKSKVKLATKQHLINVDWAKVMEICDDLNANACLCPAVAHAVMKRLKHKNPDVGILALNLTEALVKNVESFHAYAHDRKFLDLMVKEVEKSNPSNQKRSLLRKLIGTSNTENNWRSHLEKQEKTLVLLESWAKAFAKNTKFPNFVQVYQELRMRGVRFPVPLKDELAPVFTPAVQVGEDGQMVVTDPVLKAHKENARLFREMLNGSDPEGDLKRNVMVQEMIAILKGAQKDVLIKIAENPSEGLMGQLLIVNEDIISSLKLYEDLLIGNVERKPLMLMAPDHDDHKPTDSDEEEDEEEDEENDEEDLEEMKADHQEDDILGLGVVVRSKSVDVEKAPKLKKRETAKNLTKGKKHAELDRRSSAPLAKLDPPKYDDTKSLARRRSSKKSEEILAIEDAPKKAPVQSKKSNSVDLLGLDNALVVAKPKKASKSSDEESNFLAIALREDENMKPKKNQPANPFDDLFA